MTTGSESANNANKYVSSNENDEADSFESRDKISGVFLDAMEVLYFDDMLCEQQRRRSKLSSSSSIDSLSKESENSAENLSNDMKSDAAIQNSNNVVNSLESKPSSVKKQPSTSAFVASNLKERVGANQKKLGQLAHEHRKKLEKQVRDRRIRLEKLMKDPGVVMTMDKISFVMGVLTIMLIEAVLLCAPNQMGLLYTTLLLPLMVARYIVYKTTFLHYYMYDFCYFSQVLLLIHIYKYPYNNTLAKTLFSISNGPIALAVVLWRNSLVFHSMDKMTSMFIHVLPSLVTFCRRWEDHLSRMTFPMYENMNGIGFYHSIVEFCFNPFCYYVLWQSVYLVKTEWWSKKKLQNNPEMVTSLRKMTEKKGSLSYRILSFFGEHNHLQTFVLAQAIYTIVSFLIIPLLWHSIWLHAIYLLLIFIVALSNGATYYFHVFAVRYIEQIGKQVKEK